MIQKAVSLSLAFAALTFVRNSQAQTNLLPVTINAVCTSTNANGLLQERVSNINLIDDCAVEHDLTNLDNLSLVFNVTNFSVQVVDTNGVVLCTSLAFTGGLTFTNTNSLSQSGSNATQIVFQRDVSVGTNQSPSGVISGSAAWNGTNLDSFRLTANLLYTELAAGTNSAEICRGVLRVSGEEMEENEGHGPGVGNRGNNGNHFGWQNPKNPHSRR